MSDLVSGRYGSQELFWRILGMPSNATQGNVPPRSNLPLFGLAGLTDAAQSATKKGNMVAVPVQEGDVISKVSVIVGATEGAAGKAYAAVYSGTTGKVENKLLAQSAKTSGEAALVLSKVFTLELEKAILVTPETAPNGYLYAGVVQESATISTLVSQAGVKAVAQNLGFLFNAKAPEVLSVATTAKGAGEAAAGFKAETALETAPIVFLT